MKTILFLKIPQLSFNQKKNLAHLFFLSILMMGPYLMFPLKTSPFQNKIFLFTAITAFSAYLLNCCYFIPKFLHKRRILSFLCLLLFSFLVVIFLRILLSDLIFQEEVRGRIFYIRKYFFPKETFHLIKGGIPLSNGDVVMIMPAIFPLIFTFATSTSIEITAYWIQREQTEKEIQNERLNSELLFLKSQINPHFLFNTLNNIYSLAVDKSDHTETAILMLSQMMRYMLYETNAEKVALNQEIEYLENYLSLQKLRLSQKKNIEIKIDIQNNYPDLTVAPLLMIPLVENAFKHGLSYQQDSFIHVLLSCASDQIFFSIHNSKPLDCSDANPYEISTGIGLKNIRRRLDLLYPNQYELVIQDNSRHYLVELRLKLI